MTVVIVDLETTGLDPDRHHIWEVAVIVRDHRTPHYDGEWHYMMRPNLSAADPAALRVGRYYERAPKVLADPLVQAYVLDRPFTAHAHTPSGPVARMAVAARLAMLLDDAALVGCNPTFDAAFLSRFLRAHGQSPTWHHRLVDVYSLAAGYLAGTRDGYNTSARWLADAHNGASGPGCQVADPELDTTTVVGPPFDPDDLSARLGVTGDPGQRHTAVGDARWAAALYDKATGS